MRQLYLFHLDTSIKMMDVLIVNYLGAFKSMEVRNGS